MGIRICTLRNPTVWLCGRKLADLGLEVSNFGADFWGISLGDSDANMEKYKDAFRRNLEFCLDIGGDSIRVDTAVGAGLPAIERDLAALCQRLEGLQ